MRVYVKMHTYNKTGKRISIILFPVLLASLFSILSGCTAESRIMPQMIKITSAQVTIAWDNPVINLRNGPFSITHYNIYYKEHHNWTWIYLDSIEYSETPEYTLYHEVIGNGMYDIAVSAVYSNSTESAYHSNLDQTATPFCGWYIYWIYNE